MLALGLILGSVVTYFVVKEWSSETYRCDKCDQLHTGTYHRVKCFVRTAGEQHPRLA